MLFVECVCSVDDDDDDDEADVTLTNNSSILYVRDGRFLCVCCGKGVYSGHHKCGVFNNIAQNVLV